jgi:anti-sigma B factor antagonist
MTKTIEIDIERSGVRSVVHVEGDINWETSPKLRSAILDLFDNRHQRYVVMDLNQVAHMDSSGVSTLIEGLQAARRSNGRFVLSGLAPSARHVLQLTRLASIFEIVDAPGQAMESASQAA